MKKYDINIYVSVQHQINCKKLKILYNDNLTETIWDASPSHQLLDLENLEGWERKKTTKQTNKKILKEPAFNRSLIGFKVFMPLNF